MCVCACTYLPLRVFRSLPLLQRLGVERKDHPGTLHPLAAERPRGRIELCRLGYYQYSPSRQPGRQETKPLTHSIYSSAAEHRRYGEQLVLLAPLPTSTQSLPHPHLLKSLPKAATVSPLILFTSYYFLKIHCISWPCFFFPQSHLSLQPSNHYFTFYLVHSFVLDNAKVHLLTQSAAHSNNHPCPPLLKSFVSLRILFSLPNFMSVSLLLYFKSPSTLC